MKLKCWNVTCREVDGTEHEIGVVCSDEAAAKKCAEHSLWEGRHIAAKAAAVKLAADI